MRNIILITALAALPLLPAPAQAQGMACDGRLLVGTVQMQLWQGSGEAERGAPREPMNQFSVSLRNMSAQPMGVLVGMRGQGRLPTGGAREADINAGASINMTLFRLPTSQTPPSTSTVQGWLHFMCR